ncbi:MAG: ATP-binding protein [Leptolyngbyaceae bacterium]|nr:ATP-binding protein [Leptolyngbyaceae bacterium]
MNTPLSLTTPTRSLSLESTIQELPLYECQLDIHCLGIDAAEIFEASPLLPGIILTDQDQILGLLYKEKFLRCMSRPYGLALFLKRPLTILYEFAATAVRIFPGDTLIVAAAQHALQRPQESLFEPLIVEIEPNTYRLLDVHQLLITQSQIHELATRLLREQAEEQLIQAEKMGSLGRMVAGIAHEILNPINFIWGNVGYLSNYGKDLLQLVSAFETELPQLSAKIEQLKEEIEFEFIQEDLPQIIDSVTLGADRLRKIVRGLHTFSHMDESTQRPADLHECIDNTLLILNSRLKQGIEVVRNYGDLPLVSCYSGPLSQVVMNIIGNAIDALMDIVVLEKTMASSRNLVAAGSVQTQAWQPRIEITTKICSGIGDARFDQTARWVSIQIADNGPGMSPEIQKRVFETFFTTKAPGKGTGLGLAICHQIVTEKHQGQLNLRSQEGAGTEFEILLPLR